MESLCRPSLSSLHSLVVALLAGKKRCLLLQQKTNVRRVKSREVEWSRGASSDLSAFTPETELSARSAGRKGGEGMERERGRGEKVLKSDEKGRPRRRRGERGRGRNEAQIRESRAPPAPQRREKRNCRDDISLPHSLRTPRGPLTSYFLSVRLISPREIITRVVHGISYGEQQQEEKERTC